MSYLLLFIISFLISLAFCLLIKKFAIKFDVTDKPGEDRKIHKKPIPLLGGVGVYLALLSIVLLYFFFAPQSWPNITDLHVTQAHLFGILFAGLFLVIGGALDDKFNLKPSQQIIWPILSVLAIICSGIGVDKITNPFGGFIYLDQWKIYLFMIDGSPKYFTVWSDLLTFVWLLTTIYTTKFLDGLDGLVSGMTSIGSLIIAILSLFFFINYPTVLLAIIASGVFAGFLVLNFNPAKMFLGEAGSTFAGLMLGVLAIISGAKVATAVLIMGLPILDAVWVIFRRVLVEHKSPFKADRKHLHFRLLDAGFSQRQAVAIIWTISVIFGVTALFLQSQQKLIGLGMVALVMIILASTVVMIRKKRHLTLDER
jgi:UDP-GlcNAc:undecaprenyl-phosphate/decaprenyl-phosphate GlcNAc-1-phosphate transferase